MSSSTYATNRLAPARARTRARTALLEALARSTHSATAVRAEAAGRRALVRAERAQRRAVAVRRGDDVTGSGAVLTLRPAGLRD